MDFDSINRLAARQQLLLLGGVAGAIEKAGVTINPVIVLIERDVQMPADNGLTVESRTVASLLKEEVGKVVKGNRIVVNSDNFTVGDLISDDGFVVAVFVRG